MLYALALATCLSPVAPALDGSVRALIKEGDVLSNGAVVTGFLDIALADNASWAAIVVAGGTRHLVRDGVLVRSEGEIIQGAVVDLFNDVELSRDGVIGVRYSVEDPASPGSSLTRIQIGPDIILEEGQTLSAGPVGVAGTVEVISGFDFDGVEVAVSCSIRPTGGGSTDFTYLVGSIGGSGFVATGGYVEGGAVPGFTSPFYRAFGDLDYGGSSTSGAVADLGTSSLGPYGVIVDGVGVAQSGEPGFAPNSTWTFRSRPRVRVNNVGGYVIVGTIELSNGNDVGAIYRGDAVGTSPVAIEGALINGIAPFERLSVEIADDDTVFYVAEFLSGRQKLLASGEDIIVTGITEAEGTVITDLYAATLGDRLSITSDGREALLLGELDGIGECLLLVERQIADPVMCAVNANSTGQTGELDAEGSRFVAVNDLDIVGSSLPPLQFSLLLGSLTTGFSANPGGSMGNLCLGGDIGRFNGQVQQIDAAGNLRFDVDLTMIPQPSVIVPAMVGEVWHFQVWHRDRVMTLNTSNFTDAIAVEMR